MRISGDKTTFIASILVILVVFTGVFSGPVVGQEHSPRVDADRVVIEISIQPDGDAEWTIERRTRLDTQNITQEFNGFAQAIEQTPDTYAEKFRESMNQTVSESEARTGRNMSIKDVSVSVEKHSIPQRYGVVTYSFTWTNFASTPNSGELHVKKVLSGMFLDRPTTLAISWPTNYTATTIAPNPNTETNSSVVWRGPLEFGANRPLLILQNSSDTVVNTPTDEFPITATPILPTLGSLFLVFGVAVIVYRRGYLSGRNRSSDDDLDSDTSGAVQSGDKIHIAEDEESSNPTPDSESETDTTLLTNEEQVLELLESHDGRMKQQTVKQELGWSASKTSQVLSSMRDDGLVNVFRMGRENVVTEPDVDELA